MPVQSARRQGDRLREPSCDIVEEELRFGECWIDAQRTTSTVLGPSATVRGIVLDVRFGEDAEPAELTGLTGAVPLQ